MNLPTVVYVAGPFRGKTPWDVEQNVRRAEALALEVWRTPGFCALCPHTNTRFFQNAAPDDVWLVGDLALLRTAGAVILTKFWERSSGAKEEVRFAINQGIPIFDSIERLVENRPIDTAFLLAIVDGTNTFPNPS